MLPSRETGMLASSSQGDGGEEGGWLEVLKEAGQTLKDSPSAKVKMLARKLRRTWDLYQSAQNILLSVR